MKLKLTLIIAVVVFALAGVFFVKNSQAEAKNSKPSQQPPVNVTVFTVTSGEQVFTKDLPGRTSAYQIAEIRPQVSGIITKRFFREGSLVKAGEQLYQINPAPYQAVYEKAEANLLKAETNYNSALPKAERYAELVKVGGVSVQEYDDAVSALAQAKADIAVAKAALSAARIDLNYTKVLAPISGRIGKSAVTEGALVTTNQQSALATIQNLSKIYVDVNQSSSEMMKLRKQINGMEKQLAAQLILDGDEKPYGVKGVIQFSDVTVDESTGTVQLRILFPNEDGYILPGLFVKARIEESRQESAITVPQQAVIRNADGSASVWAVDGDNVVNPQSITVSRAFGDKWLVTDGLKEGDRIVVAGLQKIRPKAKVAPQEMK